MLFYRRHWTWAWLREGNMSNLITSRASAQTLWEQPADQEFPGNFLQAFGYIFVTFLVLFNVVKKCYSTTSTARCTRYIKKSLFASLKISFDKHLCECEAPTVVFKFPVQPQFWMPDHWNDNHERWYLLFSHPHGVLLKNYASQGKTSHSVLMCQSLR